MKELQIIYKDGVVYGIRNSGGYLFFFTKISRYPDQIKRYLEEIKEQSKMANVILKALKESNPS